MPKCSDEKEDGRATKLFPKMQCQSNVVNKSKGIEFRTKRKSVERCRVEGVIDFACKSV